jgi:MFS family permease
VKVAFLLTILLLPFIAAYLDGEMESFLSDGNWRVSLLAPTIITYIWLVSPTMSRTGDMVVEAIRSLAVMDGEEFDQVVQEASQVKPTHELFAIGIGIIFGIASVLASDIDQGVTWLMVFWLLSTGLMHGILAWTIFIAIASTRVNNALHRLPLQIDILNPKEFEAVGRQSLLLALVFIGGITLSLLFSYQEENISHPEFWITNLLFVLFTLLIFFLSMRPTHRVLANEKKHKLEPLQARINSTCRDLVLRLNQNQDSGDLPAEINALIAYEQRLLVARTWPYNVAMLRTLFFSVFIPLGSILARLAIDIFLP